ncbi:MAG: hypothetical protein ACXAD7_07065, partial [Candidatus Kariarchaeaceae archaeon]
MSEDPPNFCQQCGNPLKNSDAKFCGKCGFSLRKTGSQIPNIQHEPITEPQPASTSPKRPQYVPGVDPVASQATDYPLSYEPSSPLTQPYGSDRDSHYTTPSQVSPVIHSVFSGQEYKIIAIFALVGTISHLFRYLLIYNTFPSLEEILIP